MFPFLLFEPSQPGESAQPGESNRFVTAGQKEAREIEHRFHTSGFVWKIWCISMWSSLDNGEDYCTTERNRMNKWTRDVAFEQHLVSRYRYDDVVTLLLNRTRIHFLVSMNPDGFEKSIENRCKGERGRYLLLIYKHSNVIIKSIHSNSS